MRSIEVSGRTVEDAVTEALDRLGVDRTQVEIEVVQQPVRSLLGLFGGRDARIRVTVRRSKDDFARDFLSRVMERLPVGETRVEIHEDDEVIHVHVFGEDLGVLIGRYGQTMNAVQQLMNAAAARVTEDRRPLILDVEGYRARRREAVVRMARRAADQAARFRRPVSLDPMRASERRLVHMALRDDRRVSTESSGQEPFRKIIVRPRAGGSGGRRGGSRAN